MKFRILICMAALLSAGSVAAQTACPIGVAPGSPQCGPSAPPASGNSGVAPLPQPVPTGKWLSRYGAVAAADSGAMGVSTERRSKREADDAALQQCNKSGLPGCKLIFWYGNACMAIALTATEERKSSERTIISRGDTIEEASSDALSWCQKFHNGAECEVIHTGCSKPVFQHY